METTPQVNSMAESPVKNYLSLRKVSPILKGRKIKKAEVHWLLHFVDIRSSDQNIGSMSLNQTYMLRPMPIRTRLKQEGK
jgi:hypothetical protein